MAKYRLLGGVYRDTNGTTYKRGDIVSSNRELDRVFVGMFEKLSETAISSKQPTSPSSEGAELEVPSAPFEKDVTKQFSIAKKIGGIKVIRVTDGDKEHYNIVDSGNGQLHNSKPIISVVRVKKFLNNLMPEQPDSKEG